jgi:hypothetical protein
MCISQTWAEGCCAGEVASFTSIDKRIEAMQHLRGAAALRQPQIPFVKRSSARGWVGE